MATSVTRKGQVTIPKPVRDRFGIVPGSRVDFVEDGGRLMVVREETQPPRSRFDIPHPFPGWNGMTTDELMLLTRGHKLD